MVEGWNLNQDFGKEVVRLITLVNQAAEIGDTKLYFNQLRNLYRNVAGFQKMKSNVVDALDKQFMELRGKIDRDEPITEGGKVVYKQEMRKTRYDVDRLHIDLMAAIWQSGLLKFANNQRAEFSTLEV
jgi:hypothetical protein